MAKLIIGFDAKRLFNNLTGLGNYSRTLVDNLQRQAPQNTYILYSEKVRQNPDTVAFMDKNRFEVVTKNGFLRKFWRIFSIRKNIVADKLQIFHGLSHDIPFGQKPKNVKYVVTIHDVCFKTFPEMFAKLERCIYSLKYKNALKKADKIIAISQSTKNDILEYFPFVDPSKIEVVYQAINSVYYDLQEVEKERVMVSRYGIHGDYILYVGSINSRKNLLGVVKAYQYLSEQERLPLVVIGNGREYKQKVEAFARQAELEPYITFLDNVTLPENLRAFYRCAKMLVYPSFYEGFGLPVAESFLCQTPVITSNVSSLPEAGGEFAIYVDPNSDIEIAQAIQKILSDKEFAEKVGQNGRQFITQTLDPQKLTEQILSIYKALIDDRK